MRAVHGQSPQKVGVQYDPYEGKIQNEQSSPQLEDELEPTP